MKLRKCEYCVIHNKDFDLPFICRELEAALGRKVEEPPAFCTMTNGRWATFEGKYPNLGELCFALKVPYNSSSAHAARYDIERMMDCYFAGLKRGFYEVPAGIAKPAFLL